MRRFCFRILFALLAVASVVACGGGPVKRFFPPDVRVQELVLDPQGTTLSVRVQSFSTVPSQLERFSLSLELAGRQAAVLEAQPGSTLLPQAAEITTLNMVLSEADAAAVRTAITERRALRYRIHGTITVDPPGRRYDVDYSSALSPVPGLDGVLR